jgi:hypothetical protein
MQWNETMFGLRTAVYVATLLPLATAGCDLSEQTAGSQGDLTAPATDSPSMDGGITFTEDPIVSVGHGAALLPKGKIVTPTQDFAVAAQRYYLARLTRESDDATRSELAEVERSYRGQNPGATEPAIHARLIAWLLDRVNPHDRARLGSINAYLEKLMVRFGSTPLAPRELALVHPAALSGADYVEQCKAAGVPTPPPWRKEGVEGGWKDRGALPEVLISGDRDAHVYSYTSTNPPGVCFALPRAYKEDIINRDTGEVISKKGDFELLGVICQGNETSRSCYWDNIGDIGPDEMLTIPGPKFQGGADLADGTGGVCTDCHRGENTFIIHPGTPLSFDKSLLLARGWVNPMVHFLWPQNRKPTRQLDGVTPDAGGAACKNCHNKGMGARLGELDQSYCGILALSLDGNGTISRPTMPPRDSSYTSSQFAAHRAEIDRLCLQPRPPASNEFDAATAFGSLRTQPSQLVLGDINGDGRRDLVGIREQGELLVATAASTGFANQASVGTVPFGAGFKLQTGDFDGNGDDDVATVGANGEIAIALSYAGRLRSAATWGTSGVAADYVLTGDFDNDRKDDLLTFSAEGVTLHRSLGSRFAPALPVQVGYVAGTHRPLAGDIDGDSQVDLLLVSLREGGKTLFVRSEPRAPERFAIKDGPEETAVTEGATVQLDDVDGDGLADLITAAASGVFVTRLGAIGVVADPPRWFAPERWSSVTGQAIRAGDVDADGRADLITVADDGVVQVARSIFVERPALEGE